jgi:prepilin-type N-terminal cleavage/methylation domain-containing protein
MNRKGVTLIELLVVIVIIGILGAFLAPNIGAWLPNYRLRGAARDIVSTMRTAQMRAVSTNLVYEVSFPSSSTYILKYQNTLGAWVNEGATQKLPSGVSIITPIPGGNAVFNPNSTSSAGSLTLQNSKGTQRRLTLTSSTGRVTITTP